MPSHNTSSSTARKPKRSGAHKGVFGTNSFRCRVCRGVHALRKCQRFLRLTAEKRLRAVLINRYCTNCLAHQHSGRSCRSDATCHVCQKDHHTLLHLRDDDRETSRSRDSAERVVSTSRRSRTDLSPSPSDHSSFSHAIPTSLTSLLQHKGVSVLPTAIVVLDNGVTNSETRALIDACCPTSLIDASMATALGLSVTRVGAEAACTAVLRSRTTAMRREIILKIAPQLEQCVPLRSINKEVCEKFSHVILADERWHTPSNISLILGADVYPHIILPGMLPSQGGLPVAQNTEFGWILTGTCSH